MGGFMHEGLPNESWYKCRRCILEYFNRKEKDVQSVTTFENIMTLSGYYFKPEQVRQIIDGYEGKFTKTNTRLSRNIRGFVEAIE